MTSIAVQTAVGEIGSKATTELSFGFNSLLNLGNYQVGTNSNGLFLLNSTNGIFERSVTLATTDLGTHNRKRARKLHIGIETDNDFTVSIMFDDKVWRDYPVSVLKTGLQVIKVPIGRNGSGRYLTIKITSDYWFRLDSINGTFIVRSTGIEGN